MDRGDSGRNPVNRKKIAGSKWTRVQPEDRQKHFVVLGWALGDDGKPTDAVEIEAILTGAVSIIHWRELEDRSRWRIGWC
jgi:tryptophan-rich hypothetical protein